MSDRVDYWVEAAEYDIVTARAMLETGRYLYVGFMCHQVVEKLMKAHYVKVRGEMPLRSHNLELLAEKADLFKDFDEDQMNFIRQLEPLNVGSRYPADRTLLAKALTLDKCRFILVQTEEIVKWIKQRLAK